MSALADLGVGEAAAAIRAGRLSPVELTRALLERIGRYEPRLNAFVTLDADGALAAARSAEAAVRSGAPLGPLHGVPYALKDIVDAAGLPTTCHSALLHGNVAAADAETTRRLRAAGGILVGKLSTHEFALGGPAFDLPWPPARNPWHRGMFPGGSSSGAGASVAAGFVPAAIGTDTGGSVRNPATMCGIVGIKATYGRVSRRGVFPLAFSLDHVGPLTRGVADNALLLNVLAGHDPLDPGSVDRPVPDFAAELEAGVAGLRIGVLRHFHTRDMVAAPAVTEAIERALAVFADLGAEVVEIETAPLQDFAACNRILLLSEACAVHERWLRERPEGYARLTRERLLPGLFLGAVDYVQAMRWRGRLTADFERALDGVDVVVAASNLDPPFPIDDPAEVERCYPRQARTPFNLTGHPALAIPIGFTDDGLPLGLQLAARNWAEATLYRVAHAYEQATPWHKRRPDLERTAA